MENSRSTLHDAAVLTFTIDARANDIRGNKKPYKREKVFVRRAARKVLLLRLKIIIPNIMREREREVKRRVVMYNRVYADWVS